MTPVAVSVPQYACHGMGAQVLPMAYAAKASKLIAPGQAGLGISTLSASISTRRHGEQWAHPRQCRRLEPTGARSS